MNETPAPRSGSLDELPTDEPYPGVRRRRFDADNVTVAAYRFEPGASFPLHSHPQEQVTLVVQGDLKFTTGDLTTRMVKGDWSIVPGDVAHGLQAGDHGARVFAIIAPRRGTGDAYTVITES